MSELEVWIESHGLKCAATLYLPDSAQPRPVIVMAHGLGGIREMRLNAFAKAFRAAGFACLLFDYRYFGSSEGEPRQLLDIESQIKDWEAAIKYARGCNEVDTKRVILWGSSFSGGHVLRLGAQDHDIEAIVSQCPFTDGFASSMTLNVVSHVKLGVLAICDLLASVVGRGPVYVKLTGKSGDAALMTAPDCASGYGKLVPEGEAGYKFENRCAARFALQIMRSFPGKRAKNITCPVLFCICDKDTVAPAPKSIKHAEKAPRGVIMRYPYGHFEIYVEDAFEAVLKDQIQFLKRSVPFEDSA